MTAIFDRLFALLQALLPQRALSAVVHRLVRVRRRWFKNALIHSFADLYGVNRTEAAEPDLEAYPDFNAFFVRALAPGSRPLGDAGRHVLCPADGQVHQVGEADGAVLPQAKGRTFTLPQLLGSESIARHFDGGPFVTVYLSPRDYHRVHMPLDGYLLSMTHIPGRLFSVNGATSRAVPELFARNERVVTLFRTPAGPMAVVLVGAMLVSSIETVWHGTITPPRRRDTRHWDYTSHPATQLKAGDELGRFNMGSTVIVLFPARRAQWLPTLDTGVAVRMGEPLGRWHALIAEKALSRPDAELQPTRP